MLIAILVVYPCMNNGSFSCIIYIEEGLRHVDNTNV